MSLILNIETATPICSVCLAQDGRVIGYRENSDGNSHARLLTVMIEELLSANSISLNQLDAVAVSSGPGSYTGLRIGVSVAKGLCYSLNIPLISVPTLGSMAEGLKQKSNSSLSYYLSIMDSKRMDAFIAIFDVVGNEVVSTKLVTIDNDFEKEISVFGQLIFGGSGRAVEKFRTMFNSDRFIYVGDSGFGSQYMTNISEQKWRAKKFEDVAYFQPFYFGEFEPVKKKEKQ